MLAPACVFERPFVSQSQRRASLFRSIVLSTAKLRIRAQQRPNTPRQRPPLVPSSSARSMGYPRRMSFPRPENALHLSGYCVSSLNRRKWLDRASADSTESASMRGRRTCMNVLVCAIVCCLQRTPRSLQMPCSERRSKFTVRKPMLLCLAARTSKTFHNCAETDFSSYSIVACTALQELCMEATCADFEA